MPDPERVDAFARLVEVGDFIAAIEGFYAEDAWMQENADPPRRGRNNLIAHERRVMAAFPQVTARRLGPALIAGDTVAMRWRFEMRPAEGPPRRFEEVSWQLWRDDRIAEERFFYDPRQMAG
ncbi:nuclear transport factor 2 family protein [Marinibaculum pumilum]|uniref:Nuclear transport factor 2 family protein n=1 Tax=Marinibaculum pumilum TaxID=1766165 RepID=A0ABV7KZD1_9PROT